MHFSFNKKKNYFIVFISMCLIISFAIKSILSILFLVICIFSSFNRKKLINKKYILFTIIIIISFIIYWSTQILLEFNLINFLINKSNIMWIRDESIKFVDKNYNKEGVKSLLLLMLFNKKTKLGWEIYKQLKFISVCHIIVISGFHLNVIISLFNKVLKNKYLSTIINFIILFFISLFLNFSDGVTRVFIMWIITILDKDNRVNQFEKLTLSAIIYLFLFPKKLFSFSFQMSYLATFTILYIGKIYKKKFLNDLLVNFTINVYLYPIISKINNTFSLWSFVYSFLFSWIYLFDFISFLFFFIPGIEYFYTLNYFITEFSIRSFIELNIVIKTQQLNCYFEIFYYLIIFYISWVIYKLKGI